VGTTTLAINTAIALHRTPSARSCWSTATCSSATTASSSTWARQALDRRRCSATGIDADLVRRWSCATSRASTCCSRRRRPRRPSWSAPNSTSCCEVVEVLRSMYDYVVVDLDKRLDDHTLDVIGAADQLMVVMTADLSCLKNVRLLLDTMAQIGVPDERMALVSTATTPSPASASSRPRACCAERSRTRWSTTTGPPSRRSTAARRSWPPRRLADRPGDRSSWPARSAPGTRAARRRRMSAPRSIPVAG
jgi:hypothetical protein